MIGIYNTISLNGHDFKRPSDFVIQREDIYAGEYTTCTGATKADRVGWKYSDMTLTFDELTPTELGYLFSISGAVPFVFSDADGSHTENVICTGIMNTPTRFTLPDNSVIWKDCEIGLRFIDAHN